MLVQAPQMAAWYMKLYGIDPRLSVQYFPVNEAIKKVLEMVLLDARFRKRPA